MKIFILILISLISLIGLHFNGFSSNDFWIQASIGEYIIKNLQLPHTGMYSFTVAKDFSFVFHEWLSSIILALIARLGPDEGLVFALSKTLIAVISFYLIYKLCLQKSKSLLVSICMALLVSYAISFRLSLRAENLIFILLPLHLILFEKYIKTTKKLFLLFMGLNYCIWANMHGSYLLVFPIILVSLMGLWIDSKFTIRHHVKLYTPYVLSLSILFLTTFINPYGFSLIAHVFTMSSSKFLSSYVNEWQPTFSEAFMQTPAFYIYILYSLMALTAFLLNFKKASWSDKLVFLMMLLMSALALRHTLYYFIVSSPFVACWVSLSSEKIKKAFLYFTLTVSLAGIAFTFSIGNFIQNKVGIEFDAPLKLDTIQWLRKQKITGPIFNSYTLGDQIIYNFYPEASIVVDARTDFYGEDYIIRYLNTLKYNEPFFEFLENFKIKTIILNELDFEDYFIANTERLKKMDSLKWKISFRQNDNVILTRP